LGRSPDESASSRPRAWASSSTPGLVAFLVRRPSCGRPSRALRLWPRLIFIRARRTIPAGLRPISRSNDRADTFGVTFHVMMGGAVDDSGNAPRDRRVVPDPAGFAPLAGELAYAHLLQSFRVWASNWQGSRHYWCRGVRLRLIGRPTRGQPTQDACDFPLAGYFQCRTVGGPMRACRRQSLRSTLDNRHQFCNGVNIHGDVSETTDVHINALAAAGNRMPKRSDICCGALRESLTSAARIMRAIAIFQSGSRISRHVLASACHSTAWPNLHALSPTHSFSATTSASACGRKLQWQPLRLALQISSPSGCNLRANRSSAQAAWCRTHAQTLPWRLFRRNPGQSAVAFGRNLVHAWSRTRHSPSRGRCFLEFARG